MIIHSKPSAIIFDFDDTLVNARPIIQKALSSTFAKFNINKEIIQNKDIDINRSLRDYFHHIFADNIKAAREAYYEYYDEFSQDLVSLKHAEEVLKLLNKHKVFTTVVSNKGGERLRKEIHHKFAWHNYFSSIVGAGDAPEDKPSSLPAKLALHNSKITEYSNVWLIGDSVIDLKTAENLGCKGILFGDNNTHVKDVSVYLNVKNHTELLNLLQEIYD